MTSWLEKLLPGVAQRGKKKADVPEGVWRKCNHCGAMLYMPELERAHLVCPKCDGHLRMTAEQRLQSFFDPGSFERFAEEKEPVDRLKFKDLKKYKDRLTAARKTTGETEAVVVAQGQVFDITIVAAAFEFRFMGGSMGASVGERFIAGVQRAIALDAPFVCFAASGGARMQEGLFSLMQMAKTSAALNLLKHKGLPFISVLTDPVYGGVSASFAMLGDVIIAEPGAMIGFAGPRVIEQTVRETLPDGFQKSEFLLEKGAVDMIVHRSELRGRICTLVRLFGAADLSVVPIERPLGYEAQNVEEALDDGTVANDQHSPDSIPDPIPDSEEVAVDVKDSEDNSDTTAPPMQAQRTKEEVSDQNSESEKSYGASAQP